MSVLCGTNSEKCHSKYGSMSLQTKYCHEMVSALRHAGNDIHSLIIVLTLFKQPCTTLGNEVVAFVERWPV